MREEKRREIVDRVDPRDILFRRKLVEHGEPRAQLCEALARTLELQPVYLLTAKAKGFIVGRVVKGGGVLEQPLEIVAHWASRVAEVGGHDAPIGARR